MVLFLKYKIWQGTDWGQANICYQVRQVRILSLKCVTVWCLVLKFHLLSLLLSFYCPNYCGRWKENINCRHKYKYKENYLLIKQMNAANKQSAGDNGLYYFSAAPDPRGSLRELMTQIYLVLASPIKKLNESSIPWISIVVCIAPPARPV